jgi:hypothetical protein
LQLTALELHYFDCKSGFLEGRLQSTAPRLQTSPFLRC